MTLIHLLLVHRFKADSVHYVTPTEDDTYQASNIKSDGIFREVSKEVGQIIVVAGCGPAGARAVDSESWVGEAGCCSRSSDQRSSPSIGP